MARKPKIQPSHEPVPARRGRKPKAAAPSLELPLAASLSGPATDGAGSDGPKVGPTKAPGRRGPGRKPKQAAGAETAPAVLNDAAQPEAGAIPNLIGDDAPTAAAVPQTEAAADSGPAQPGVDPGNSADEAAQSFSEADAFVSAKPAAQWDRTTDRVQFDWPVIERAAAQDGPNKGMAKLLVAARAEGARSRWPF